MSPRPVPLAAAAATALVGYAALVERRACRLRRVEVPVLPAGAEPVRVLHVSDLHMTPGQRWKVEWVRSLAALEPDLVVDTGDNLAHMDAVPAVLHAFAPLLDRSGVFVSGSNDYYAPTWKNPGRYLLPDTGHRVSAGRLPWPELRRRLREAGWLDLTNRRDRVRVRGLSVEVAGTGDPHIWADRYRRVAGAVPPDADVGLGLVHAPEPRVVDHFAADGFRLVMCGHTHGGQLRLPGVGALVTNCGLDTGRARGLSRWSERTWLHVSAGLGTSPYAPVRFACPPEATLLTLLPG